MDRIEACLDIQIIQVNLYTEFSMVLSGWIREELVMGLEAVDGDDSEADEDDNIKIVDGEVELIDD